jgi:hypothetical protein
MKDVKAPFTVESGSLCHDIFTVLMRLSFGDLHALALETDDDYHSIRVDIHILMMTIILKATQHDIPHNRG